MTTIPKHALWYDVPAGTRAATCRGENCGATIYFVTTPKGAPCPVDCAVDGGIQPSEKADPHQLGLLGQTDEVRDGRGVSHFFTCVDVGQFGGKRGAR